MCQNAHIVGLHKNFYELYELKTHPHGFICEFQKAAYVILRNGETLKGLARKGLDEWFDFGRKGSQQDSSQFASIISMHSYVYGCNNDCPNKF
jgi:hypothetical protein